MMCKMCKLSLDQYAEAVSRFINDTEGYEGDAPRYKVRLDQESRASIMDKRDGIPIIQGCTMREFNDSYGTWWNEYHSGKVPF